MPHGSSIYQMLQWFFFSNLSPKKKKNLNSLSVYLSGKMIQQYTPTVFILADGVTTRNQEDQKNIKHISNRLSKNITVA